MRSAADHFGVTAQGASLLSGGLLNQTWRLGCSDHDRVLRVSRVERRVDQVRYEHAFARAVRDAVPSVVGAESAATPVLDGHVLSLFPLVAGTLGVAVDPVLRTRAVVAAMAGLHRASLERFGSPPAQRPGCRAIDAHPRWWRWPTLRDQVSSALSGPQSDLRRAVGVIDRAVSELDDWLEQLNATGRLTVRACVHADLNPRNLIFRGADLVGIIDLDDCRVEPLVSEVAQTAYGSARVSPRQVWQWYQEAGGPLPESDHDLLLGFARIGVLSELQWLLDDGRPTTVASRRLPELAAQLGGRITRDE